MTQIKSILRNIFVKRVFEIVQNKRKRIYLLEFPWFGEIAIFVLLILLDFSSNTKYLKLPQCFNQIELNDLVRDFRLSKQAAELLASRCFFLFCHNILSLLSQLGVSLHNPTDCLSIAQSEASNASICIMTILLVLFQFIILFI